MLLLVVSYLILSFSVFQKSFGIFSHHQNNAFICSLSLNIKINDIFVVVVECLFSNWFLSNLIFKNYLFLFSEVSIVASLAPHSVLIFNLQHALILLSFCAKLQMAYLENDLWICQTLVVRIIHTLLLFNYKSSLHCVSDVSPIIYETSNKACKLRKQENSRKIGMFFHQCFTCIQYV